ncbi:MAG: YggS family pyridoxal phosphate-dependent enzyme [Anaerolineales bacterium]
MLDAKQLEANLASIRLRIAVAARQAGRAPEEISLVVVTKGHPVGALRTLWELGIRDLGESYVQEGRSKQVELGELPGLLWHMIGHVQSRKAEDVTRHFGLVHAVDSLKLATRLDRFAAQTGKTLPVLLEVNVSGEASKHGWPAKTDTAFQAALPEIAKVLQLPNVLVRGLMCMAPMTPTSAGSQPYFARTRALLGELKTRHPEGEWSQLSMGMSDDFEAAIREGSTLLRIGTAILGPRPA